MVGAGCRIPPVVLALAIGYCRRRTCTSKSLSLSTSIDPSAATDWASAIFQSPCRSLLPGLTLLRANAESTATKLALFATPALPAI